MSEMIETEDVDTAEANAADLVGEEEISFDFQTVLDNLQNLLASYYGPPRLDSHPYTIDSGIRMMAAIHHEIKANDPGIHQPFRSGHLSDNAEEALVEDEKAHIYGLHSSATPTHICYSHHPPSSGSPLQRRPGSPASSTWVIQS